MKTVAVILLALAVWPASASAEDWVRGGGQTCQAACRQHHSRPVSSGTYSENGAPYFICRADAGGQGARPGYNLEPSWSGTCTVPFGGKEQAVRRYECLCR